jgi:hypothetical protein
MPNGAELLKKITESRERLKAAWESEEVSVTTPCPLEGGRDVPPHGGKCCQCSAQHLQEESHTIPRSDEALAEAERLMGELLTKPDIGRGEARTDLLNDAGSMFGVLVCVNSLGQRVVLKAFSGGFDSTGIKDVPGWCPALEADPAGELRFQGEVFRQKRRRDEAKTRIDEINEDLERSGQTQQQLDAADGIYLARIGKLDLTVEEWKELGYDPAPIAKPGKGSEPYKAVANKMYNPRNAARKERAAAWTSKRESLEKERYELSEWLKHDNSYEEALIAQRRYLAEQRKIKNYKNEERSLMDACCPPSMEIATNGQMAACAAPKLLAEARRQGLIPVSLAEFWYGKNTEYRKHMNYYESCPYCRSILGFALCGLAEAQRNLDAQLDRLQEIIALDPVEEI